MTCRTTAAAALSALLLLSGVFTPAAATSTAAGESSQAETGPEEAPEPPGEITREVLADSVSQYDAEASVEELGGETEEDDVVVLETDLLFAAMEWELTPAANSAIVELVEEVPEGAVVGVHGHTDSNPVPEGHDFDNQELSERRAEAVAEVLEEERPDLELEVEGFGDSDPAVTEDPDDPSTFAANRRVEIRYGD